MWTFQTWLRVHPTRIGSTIDIFQVEIDLKLWTGLWLWLPRCFQHHDFPALDLGNKQRFHTCLFLVLPFNQCRLINEKSWMTWAVSDYKHLSRLFHVGVWNLLHASPIYPLSSFSISPNWTWFAFKPFLSRMSVWESGTVAKAFSRKSRNSLFSRQNQAFLILEHYSIAKINPDLPNNHIKT